MEHNVVKNKKCEEGMKRMPKGCVDMIFCDPPYGNTAAKWDKRIDLDVLWNHFLRIIKPNGAIIFTSMEPYASEIIISQPDIFRYDLIWDKVGVTGFLNANKRPLRRHEHILVFYKEQPTYNPQKYAGKPYSKTRTKIAEVYQHVRGSTINIDGLMHPTSIVTIPKASCIGSNQQRKQNSINTTQKPVKLLRYLILTYTNPGDLVFDPCMGSHTTAVAAIKEGRKYFGFETDTRQCELGGRRVEKENQIKTFNYLDN